MITSIVAYIIACSTLIPFDPGVRESPVLLDQGISLSEGVVYRRWDLNIDGKRDIMTVHVIDPTQLERYRTLQKNGENYDVHFFTRPVFYWVDLTGKDAWDAIYVDEQDNGRCRLYAQRDTEY